MYQVLLYPDSFLRLTAKEVLVFNDELQHISNKMLETMYRNRGIGLAATQVGVDMRVFVMDTQLKDGKAKNPQIFINPTIQSSEGSVELEEGCLSLPGHTATIKRKETVVAAFSDVSGTKQEIELSGLEAVCFQHEVDHLNGVLFVDYLSPLKRNIITKSVKKHHAKNS